jgi:prepilin-type N-terminal cleavage/methylation domain-containing protein
MTKRPQTEKGFTLVELAIVLVIVGLLIAGILKGQELITNSQITSTISQIEGLGGAVNTFKQKYGAYPGDMSNASTRLINCAANPCNNGNGNSVINVNVGAINAITNESAYFFNHLRAAELITSFDGTAVAQFGAAFPGASIGGGYMVGDTRNGAPTGFNAADFRPGPYLVLTGQIAAVTANTGVLTPSQGARIDRTIDDGQTSSGSVIAQNTALACRTAAADDDYAEDAQDQACVIAYRLPK